MIKKALTQRWMYATLYFASDPIAAAVRSLRTGLRAADFGLAESGLADMGRAGSGTTVFCEDWMLGARGGVGLSFRGRDMLSDRFFVVEEDASFGSFSARETSSVERRADVLLTT